MNTPIAFTDVPTIDISALFADDPDARATVVAALDQAAREVGFFRIAGHGIPDTVFDTMLQQVTQFFARPLDEKMHTYIGNSSNHRGYVPEGEEVFADATPDNKEAFDLSLDLPADDPDYLDGNPLLGPNQWPQQPGFKEAVTAYYDAVFAVGRTLLEGFGQALGLQPDYFATRLRKPPSQLRLIHYPFDPDAHDRPGIGAHTDYEFLTLLRPTAPGLEVLNGHGEWIDVAPVEGTYVINIGDMLEILTGGTYIATTHRVRKVAQERYSFPLFFNLDYDTEVTALPQFTDAPGTAHTAVRCGDHLFAQTAQSFTYLRRRIDSGELVLPEGSAGLSSFGQAARHKAAIR